MVICPIARMVHCTGCAIVKWCPAKTLIGDYTKADSKDSKQAESEDVSDVKTQDERSA